MVVLLVLAATAGANEPLTWDTVNAEALEVFEAGPGRFGIEQAKAARRAGHAVPIGPTSVRAEGQLGLAEQRQVLVALQMPLGFGIASRRYWAAEHRARLAETDTARWLWLQEVQRAWLAWWTASEISEHLDAYAAEVADELRGFELAVDEGLLAPIALEDLRAESLQVRAEAAAMEQEARVAEAQVWAMLGERELDAGDHELHEVHPEGPNPWEGLATQAAELPEVREAGARAESARRQARSLGTARVPVLEAGPMWAPDAAGAMRPFVFVGLSVPLQPGVGPDQRAARGVAAAAEADRRWRERSAAAQLAREALAWDAARTRLERLQDEVIGPLAQRQERLEQALADGLVTADRVVRARQDRHQAEHEQVLVAGELLASEARADAVRQLLRGTGGMQ